jgi:hypothetical protein
MTSSGLFGLFQRCPDDSGHCVWTHQEEPQSTHSHRASTPNANVCLGSILLKNSVSQQHENSSEYFNRLVRASQINCAVLSRVRLDFHATSATPSYIQYAMPLKSQIKSPLISKQSFSTE